MPVLPICMAAVLCAGPAFSAAAQTTQGDTTKSTATKPTTAVIHLHTSRYARKTGPEKRKLRTPPAQPPSVTLQHGQLTVHAENSDLGTILGDVAQLSGMRIEGLDASAHVFGVYGPGNPRQVITELLDGVGYNFMLVGGTEDGAPQELLVTARAGAEPSNAAAPSVAAQTESSEDTDQQQQPLGPGAILHVPPSVVQQADPSQTQQRVQQNLQRLQKMRQQMQQQQENQPQ
jgi:hypothetical protein